MTDSAGGSMPDLRAMAFGDALVALHHRFRRQLVQIRQEVDDDSSSAPNTLMTDLTAHCLAFCQQLHAHHSEEDAALFPHLRELSPDLSEVLDRLSDEHQVVARMLNELQAVLSAYSADAATRDREHLRHRLREISATIEDHLDYEEQELVPLLNALTAMPGADGHGPPDAAR